MCMYLPSDINEHSKLWVSAWQMSREIVSGLSLCSLGWTQAFCHASFMPWKERNTSRFLLTSNWITCVLKVWCWLPIEVFQDYVIFILRFTLKCSLSWGPHNIGLSWLSFATAWSWSIILSGQNLVKTWQKPVTTSKAFIDKRNGLFELAWNTAYGDISHFLASDLAGSKASSVKINLTSFSVGGAVNLNQNSFMGRLGIPFHLLEALHTALHTLPHVSSHLSSQN